MIDWLQVILTAIATATIAFGLHEMDVEFIKANQAAALAAQKQELSTQCDEAKQLTEKVSHDYETQLSSLNAQLSKLRQSTICVPIAPNTPRHNGPAASSRSPGKNEIAAGTLYDYAGDYAKERLQLVACQNFVTQTWEMKRGR